MVSLPFSCVRESQCDSTVNGEKRASDRRRAEYPQRDGYGIYFVKASGLKEWKHYPYPSKRFDRELSI